MSPVLQTCLPILPWMDPRTARLPGMLPLGDDDWLRIDEAFAGQMAERDRLIADSPQRVHAMLPRAAAACGELYATILAKLSATDGYRIGATRATRPDGVTVPLDAAAPLLTLGRLVQEDLCVMQDGAGGHVLTGAILCFPASWTLGQKIGRPLVGIHAPVARYDDGMAARVQRLFDAIRPDHPLWRGNSLLYDDPALHQPRAEGEDRPRPTRNTYVRSERQCLVRLPESRAVVFTIHTYVLRADDLPANAVAALRRLHP